MKGNIKNTKKKKKNTNIYIILIPEGRWKRKWQQNMLNKNICKFNTRTIFRNKKAIKDIHAPRWMNRGTGAL